MSLMKTLAKVAIGVAVAKGANAMMKRGRSGGGAGGLGGLLGGLTGGSSSASGGAHGDARGGAGGLQDMMGSILGGKRGGSGASSGGLGGLLESLGGAGGLGGLLGGLAGAGAAGGMFGGSGGGDIRKASHGREGANDSSFGQVFNSSFPNADEPEIEPTPEQEVAAGLMLRAMLMAAKSDGHLDEGEKQKILKALEDATPEEREFVQEELRAPVDAQSLAGQVPKGLEPQIYVMSVMGIELDTLEEAKYLHELAGAMGLKPAQINEIHDQLGVPRIYK